MGIESDSGHQEEKRPRDEQLLQELLTFGFEKLKNELDKEKPKFEYELEFVRRISMKQATKVCSEARNYFLGDFSLPILKSIAAKLFGSKWTELLSDYYIFISKANEKTGVPYAKLVDFDGKNNSTLKHYVRIITERHFTEKKKKTDKRTQQESNMSKLAPEGEKNGKDLIEIVWFELLAYKHSSEIDIQYDPELVKFVMDKMALLPYREQLVIKLTVLDDVSLLDAYEDLKQYIKQKNHPSSNKKKQDAISILKGRAIKHLKQLLEYEIEDYR